MKAEMISFDRKEAEALFFALRVAVGTQAGKLESEYIDEWKSLIKTVRKHLSAIELPIPYTKEGK